MNAAEVLHAAGICSLPTDAERIAEHYGIKLVSYSSVAKIYEKTMEQLYEISRHGYSFRDGGSLVCAINENCCGEARRRWTIAHELAHCLLGHICGGEHSLEEERAADDFAAELLAPTAVVNFCGVSSAQELSRLCRISYQAAGIRFGELTARRRTDAARYAAGESASALSAEELICVSDFSGFISRYLLERARRERYAEPVYSGDRLTAFC